MNDKILEWFANGETGISSKAMARAIAGLKRDTTWSAWGDHPSDPSDFNRCVKFLKAVPEARQHLNKVATLSKVWETLVQHWDELEKLLEEELPNNRCPKLYDRMKELGC